MHDLLFQKFQWKLSLVLAQTCSRSKNALISSIFDKCSMLLQTIWPSNHTSHTNVYFNEFVANALRDNIGSKKINLYPQKINEAVFSFKYQKYRVRVNHTITHNQCNQTQLHKVNYFDFCFVSKCLHISNSRTKPAGLDF